MDILQLSHYLDNLLDIKEIKDSSNAMNGLQVQNTGDIKKVGLAVDLCMATIEKAVAAECNMMFVHHGMLWGGVKPIRGNFYDKISTMICEKYWFIFSAPPIRHASGIRKQQGVGRSVRD